MCNAMSFRDIIKKPSRTCGSGSDTRNLSKAGCGFVEICYRGFSPFTMKGMFITTSDKSANVTVAFTVSL